MADHVSRVMAEWASERPDLDTSPQALIARLHRVANRLTEELVEVYAQFGLGEGEFDILATLRRQGTPYTLTPSELAAQSVVSSGAITKRVDRCERQGWITRTTSESDGRSRLIRLTPAGKRLIDAAFTAHIANEHRLLEALAPQQRAALTSALTTWAEELGL